MKRRGTCYVTHPADVIDGNGAPLALVLDPLRSVHGHCLVGEEGQRELDDQASML
jgi:hypothetical protein